MATLAPTPDAVPSRKPASRSARLIARLKGYRLMNDYDPFHYQMRADDPPITLPGGRGIPALLCDLLCRRVWVIAIDNAGEGPIRVDRWDLFSAAADVSDTFSDLPTATMLGAVAGAAEFFGLTGYRQA